MIGETREVLGAVPGIELREMDNNGRQTFCCGAGGGRMWMEEKRGTRINAERTRQALATGAEAVATACPFCLVMMRDGVADRRRARRGRHGPGHQRDPGRGPAAAATDSFKRPEPAGRPVDARNRCRGSFVIAWMANHQFRGKSNLQQAERAANDDRHGSTRSAPERRSQWCRVSKMTSWRTSSNANGTTTSSATIAGASAPAASLRRSESRRPHLSAR